jgi:hypothetical protein
MSTVQERFPSRNSLVSDNSSAERHYWVTGETSGDQAGADALAAAPATHTNAIGQVLVPVSLSVDQFDNDGHYVVITYGPRKYPETGDSSYSFDTGGGTQHITQSLNTIQRVGVGGSGVDVPDFKGAIGVHGDNIEGVDIPSPKYHFTETHYIAVASVTDAYKDKLKALTGRVNNATFRNSDAGEVLFLGAAGSQRGEDDWEITFRFAVSDNETGLTVGDISGINKKGWEYLWIVYEDVHSTAPEFIVKVPLYAYVEQVHYEGNFADLGI